MIARSLGEVYFNKFLRSGCLLLEGCVLDTWGGGYINTQ